MVRCLLFLALLQTQDPLEHALQLLRQNQLAQARAELEIIVGREPGNLRAIAYLITADIQAGAPERAVMMARSLVEAVPENVEFHALLGRAYVANTDWSGAAEEWRKVLDQRPNSEEAHMELAQTYLQMGRFTDGLAEATRSVEINPQRSEAHAIRGNVLAALGTFEEAAKEWNVTLGIDQNNPAALSGLAVYLRSSQPDVALDYARRAVELSDWKAIGPIRILTLVYETRGEWDHAREALNKGLDRFPENPMLKAELRTLSRYETGAKEGKPPVPVPAAPAPAPAKPAPPAAKPSANATKPADNAAKPSEDAPLGDIARYYRERAKKEQQKEQPKDQQSPPKKDPPPQP